MVDIVTRVNNVVNGFVWGPFGLALLLCTGLWLSVRTGFFQFRRMGYWLKHTIGAIFTNKDITAHTSGSIFVLSQQGGESMTNMAELLLAAMAQRPEQQMYGVPFHLMVDPGSGAGGAFKNLARRLQINLIVNQAGNPRAKGQVENAHNIVETSFESGFKFTHVPDIVWINA